MSNLYVTEPPTNGKVLLTTNRGEIEIELWSREAPKACRNFIQLCLEGYYIDTIFHRIVTDFIIQGGDPTGTGTGGQSIFDEPFADEFHSRLKYNRRGLVGMANNGKNDNGSQFFITLDSTPELQGKNTLFGRVMGDTIFNVTKIGASEREGSSERPLYAARITATEVIVNPFSDIEPRSTRAELEKRKAAQLKANAPSSKSTSKNKKLLSFVDQEDEDLEDVVVFKSKSKSAHDLLNEDRLQPAKDKVKPAPRKRKKTPPPEDADDDDLLDKGNKNEKSMETIAHSERSRSISPTIKAQEKGAGVNDVQAQINALTSSLKRKRVEAAPQPKEPEMKLSYNDKHKAESAPKAAPGDRKKGPRKGFTEEEVLAKLAAFQAKLSSALPEPDMQATEEVEDRTCDLHGVPGCMSCFDRLGEVNDHASFNPASAQQSDTSWLSHTLVFAADKLGKDATFKQRAEADLEVIDPREKAGKIALQRRQEKRERDEKSGKNAYLRGNTQHDAQDRSRLAGNSQDMRTKR